MSDGYNGWSNYETWNVKLWMDNDQGGYEYWQEAVEEAVQAAINGEGNPYADSVKERAAMILADRMESEYSDSMQDMLDASGQSSSCWADLLGASLGRVDWREIADNMLSDVSIYSAGWNMPGCLPDSDPAFFASFDEAKSYIIDSIKEAEDASEDEQRAESLCALAEDVNLESKPFSTGTAADGYVYWVSEV